MEDPGRSGPHTAPELQCVVGGVSMEGLCKHKLVRSPELRLYIGRMDPSRRVSLFKNTQANLKQLQRSSGMLHLEKP